MLDRLHNNILIVGLLSIILLGTMALDRSLCLMTAGTLMAFVTQMGLLLYSMRGTNKEYSEMSLFGTVLVYSLLVGAVFMIISVIYSGDTFMFSKSDAWLYYTNSMRSRDIGLAANLKRLAKLYEFEDLGALYYDSILMAIIPSKFFLNIVNMFTGALSAVMLFRIGRHFMSETYAYMGALAYGTSSYLIFFHCSFLKESFFVFLVICAMYFFYRAVADGILWSLVFSAVFLGLILFFRPAVSALLFVSFLSYFALSSRQGSALSFFLYGGVLVLLVLSLTVMQGFVDNYTGGDLGAMVDYGTVDGYSSKFSLFVSSFAAPFGPFPSLFPKTPGSPITINFYGAGLTYRLFLVIPLWMGVIYSIKEKNKLLAPVVVFVIAGMLGTAFVMASLELRKVMTHIPFTLILAFYGLYIWERQERKSFISEPIIHAFAVGILVLWNLIRG